MADRGPGPIVTEATDTEVTGTEATGTEATGTEVTGTAVTGPEVTGPGVTSPEGPPERPARSLSPSRALDFQSCPLLYRFRVLDRLPEPPSPAAVRGTLVHSVLEALYDLPAGQRTLDSAIGLVAPQWELLVQERPEVVTMLADAGTDSGEWLRAAGDLVESYFSMEDPTRLEPAERELRVEAALPSGLVLRGFVDRLDRAPTGALRVVDYKTGKAPGVGFEARAMFQMRFYALTLWHMHGQLPTLLQLMYLSTGVVLRYEPDEDDLRAMQRKVEALWAAIERAMVSGDWRPSRSALCSWCAHKELCPAWGGTPPPLPSPDQPSPDQPSPGQPSPDQPSAQPRQPGPGATPS